MHLLKFSENFRQTGNRKGPPAKAMKTLAIVNPTAGWHRAPRQWPALLKAMGREASCLVTRWTRGPGHAEELAAEARRQGFERVVVAGGDGSLIETVNGLWWEPQGELPSLGIIPLGTSCDYARNFDLGHSLAENFAVALGENLVPVAAGLCRLRGPDGKPKSRIFVNVLGLGFDGNLIHRFKRRHLPWRGKFPYVISAVQEFFHLKHYALKGKIGPEEVAEKIGMLVVGLGRRFGGGFWVAPGASPHAGRFQVVWFRNLSRLQTLGLVPLVMVGQHLDHSKVGACYADHLQVVTDPPALVEAEGEPLGRTPLEVKILPGAFRLATRPTLNLEP